MSVYVVTMWDLYQDHFMGVFSSREAAEKYCTQVQKEEGEQYLISACPVQN